MSHPAFYVYARICARRELLKRGYRRSDINKMMDAATDDVVDQAAHEANVANIVGGFGDGTILKEIIDFLKSPQGLALIGALIQILLMVLGL